MKQIVQSYRTGELWLAEVPVPALQDGGVVVRTGASLVSAGTERMIMELAKKSLLGKARARPDLVKKVLRSVQTEGVSQTMAKVFSKLDTPVSLGYSCAGTVSEVGAVSGIGMGERVACAGAGYAAHAEYNFVPKNLCVRIPDSVGIEDASFTTLGAIALQGVRQAEVALGERVVVIGLGLLGLLTVQILKAAGCMVLGSDLDPERCRLAEDLGADSAVEGNPIEAALAFSGGRGADAVIITAAAKSNQPIETAAETARAKGRVVVVGLVGMDVPRDPFYRKELELRLSMSYGPGRYDPVYEEGGVDYPYGYVRWTEQRNMQSFLELVAAGRVTPGKLITHRFDIDSALDAYTLMECKSGGGSYLGIVIGYPESASSERAAREVVMRTSTRAASVAVGFVGAGNFSRSVLIPALKRANDCELVGVCTATGMSASETVRKFEFAYATTDPDRIMQDERINTVFVATRHDSHATLACAALRAGKHVFVEKPLCIKPEELKAYEDAVLGGGEGEGENEDASGARGPCLMVGFNRRFSSHAIGVREMFRRRATPLVVSYRINAGVVPIDSWVQDPARGGGRIVGEVCHFVDFCEYLVGAPPTRVFASSIATEDARHLSEDSVAITIDYADGSLAVIQYLAHGSSEVAKERIEVFADGVTAVVDDFRTTTFHGSKRPEIRGKQEKGFEAELRAFFWAVKTGGEWPIAFESLMRTTRVTFAIKESLRTGSPVGVE